MLPEHKEKLIILGIPAPLKHKSIDNIAPSPKDYQHSLLIQHFNASLAYECSSSGIIFADVHGLTSDKSGFNNNKWMIDGVHLKSNAIVLASDKSTLGIGSGQTSRLDSCQIAIDKMRKFTRLSSDIVAASDAFFPFVDGIEKLVQSGVKAVIQPNGSIRDKEIIKFANDTETILVFSKTRHFRH